MSVVFRNPSISPNFAITSVIKSYPYQFPDLISHPLLDVSSNHLRALFLCVDTDQHAMLKQIIAHKSFDKSKFIFPIEVHYAGAPTKSELHKLLFYATHKENMSLTTIQTLVNAGLVDLTENKCEAFQGIFSHFYFKRTFCMDE